MKSYFKQAIYKDEQYLKYIRSLHCICCDSMREVAAHHESFGDKAMGKNLIPDTQTIPLCVNCHIPKRHTMGFKSFYGMINKDPKLIIIRNITEYMIRLQQKRNAGR